MVETAARLHHGRAHHIRNMKAKIPMGRFVQVDEVAELAAWIASPACSFTTGFVFDITASEYRLDPFYGDYFSEQVFSEKGWPDTYIGDLGKPEDEHAVKHERQWKLGDLGSRQFAFRKRRPKLA